MDNYKHAEKAVKCIVSALESIHFHPQAIAQMLSKQPGLVQFRLWKIVKALIGMWAIDAKYQQYDEQYVEIYKWAERIDNGDA
jgi:hypothetical protein